MNDKEIELIDGFFNKGWCCDLDEVYKAVMKLQNNWNELKNWLEEHITAGTKRTRLGEISSIICYVNAYSNTLIRMQELEGTNENSKN